MRLAVLTYAWPHRKSADVLCRLWAEGFDVGVVLAAPRVPMEQERTLRMAVRSPCTLHPQKIAKRMGAAYLMAPHQATNLAHAVISRDIKRAVIAGARLLPKDVIALFPQGVLNMHPAPLPEVRGMRSLAKTMARKQQFSASTHWIDEHEDAGTLIDVKRIDWRDDDTPYDVSEKLYQLELTMMVEALRDEVPMRLEGMDVYPSERSGL